MSKENSRQTQPGKMRSNDRHGTVQNPGQNLFSESTVNQAPQHQYLNDQPTDKPLYEGVYPPNRGAWWNHYTYHPPDARPGHYYAIPVQYFIGMTMQDGLPNDDQVKEAYEKWEHDRRASQGAPSAQYFQGSHASYGTTGNPQTQEYSASQSRAEQTGYGKNLAAYRADPHQPASLHTHTQVSNYDSTEGLGYGAAGCPQDQGAPREQSAPDPYNVPAIFIPHSFDDSHSEAGEEDLRPPIQNPSVHRSSTTGFGPQNTSATGVPQYQQRSTAVASVQRPSYEELIADKQLLANFLVSPGDEDRLGVGFDGCKLQDPPGRNTKTIVKLRRDYLHRAENLFCKAFAEQLWDQKQYGTLPPYVEPRPSTKKQKDQRRKR